MKKILSLLIAILMLSGMFSLLIVPAAAEGEPADTVLKMYISDSGDDANDGLSPDAPKKTINNAVQYMKQNVGSGVDYRTAELILVGDLTIKGGSYLIYDHNYFPLTIKSEGDTKHAIILENLLRTAGETLFTNIKILNKAAESMRGGIIADKCGKLTIGAEGVANDVITYDSSISTAPLNIYGGAPTRSYALDQIDVTINCGTYKYISTASFCWGTDVIGDINFVINDANVIDGYIAIGGGIRAGVDENKVETGRDVAMDDTGLVCGGNYNVVINGGTFTRTDIVIGATGASSDPAVGARPISVEGNTVIDFNGGTFTDCEILTTESLGEDFVADFSRVDFKNGIEVNTFDLDAETAAIVAGMVNAADKADTLTKNKITVVNHSYTNLEQIDATSHKATCVCGCGDSMIVPHTFGEPEVVKEATHLEEGSEKYKCACGYEETKAIEKLKNHSYGETFEKHDDKNCKRTCECGEVKLSEHVYRDGKCTRCGSEDPNAAAATTAPAATEAPEQSGGCSSTVGMGIAFVAFAGAAAVFTCKKKKD